MQLESYDRGLIGFAEEKGLSRGSVYSMFLYGGGQFRGLRNLVRFAQVLDTTAEHLLAIFQISEESMRRLKLIELIYANGMKHFIDVDIAAGLSKNTFTQMAITRRGLKILDRCSVVANGLGMSLDRFAEISSKK
jgi:hypothetical protein